MIKLLLTDSGISLRTWPRSSASSRPAPSCSSRPARWPGAIGDPKLTYRPVGDLPDATLAVAWPEDARSPAVAAFARAACAVAATTGTDHARSTAAKGFAGLNAASSS